MDSSHPFASLIEMKRQEIDRYISLQSHRMRRDLQREWRAHIRLMWMTLEWRAGVMLRAKDGELDEAKKKEAALERYVREAEKRRDEWHRIAKWYEAGAVSLSRTLERVSKPLGSTTTGGDDEAEEAAALVGLCRRCKARESRVVLFPCRHVCACTSCEASLQECPVCGSVKSGSVEVLFR